MSSHVFFSKALRNRLVIPNKVVVSSRTNDDPQYSGSATDAASYDLLPKTEYQQMRLTSNVEAQNIAEAILSKYQLNAEMGAANVPMNCGAEVFDYVKVTDAREGDYRIGNIGSLTRNYSPGKYTLSFSFGNWLTVRKLLNDLETNSDVGNYFAKLIVDNLYAKHIKADSLDMVWLDPQGNVDLSLIGDNLDSLPDGTVYNRIKAIHLDAGILQMDENVNYKPGYDPTTKEMAVHRGTTAPTDLTKLWLDTSTTPNIMKRYNGVLAVWERASPTNLDEIGNGTTYGRVKKMALSTDGLYLSDQVYTDGQNFGMVKKAGLTADGLILMDTVVDGTYGRVKSAGLSASGLILLDEVEEGTHGLLLATDISAGHIKLTSDTKASGLWYKASGVTIDADNGINIYGTDNALTTRATETGTIQCKVDTYGQIKAGAGAVTLNSAGLHIYGAYALFYTDAGDARGGIKGVSDSFTIYSQSGYDLVLYPGTSWIRPPDLTKNLGTSTYYWNKIYAYNYYGKITSISSFQTHDDIKLVKSIKEKRVKQIAEGIETDKEITVLDFDSLPDEIKEEEGFISVPNLTSLALGAIKQMAERLDALEERYQGKEVRVNE